MILLGKVKTSSREKQTNGLNKIHWNTPKMLKSTNLGSSWLNTSKLENAEKKYIKIHLD